MGGSKVKYPEISPEERELNRLNLDVVREARLTQAEHARIQDLLAPYIYRAAGVTPRMEGGRIVGFDQAPADALQTQRESLERQLMARSEAAIRGELPLDPGLERGIAEEGRGLNMTLRQQLGPGFETSTPGAQARAEFAKRASELRASARRGELTLAEQLGLQRGQMNQAQQARQYQQIASTLGIGQPNIAGTGTLLSGIASGMAPYAAQRQGQFQASLYNAQQPGVGDFLGGVLGLGAGAFLGPFAGGLGLRAAGGGLASRLFPRGGIGGIGTFPFG
jgi:hypothetical protein